MIWVVRFSILYILLPVLLSIGVNFTKQSRWFRNVLILNLTAETIALVLASLGIENIIVYLAWTPISSYFWGRFFIHDTQKMLLSIHNIYSAVFVLLNILIYAFHFDYSIILIFTAIWLSYLAARRYSAAKYYEGNFIFLVSLGVWIYFISAAIIFPFHPSLIAGYLNLSVSIISNIIWAVAVWNLQSRLIIR